MRQLAIWIKSGFLAVGLVLSVIVGLLLFAAVAIVMRPFLIVAALLTVPASLLLYRFHPGFRQWLDSSDEQQISYNGLHLATDIAVHPNHSWARVSGKDAIVGVDDLVQSTLGPVEAVDLPPLGSRIEQGQRLFQLRRGGRCVAVRAPVSGTIVAANEALLQQPGLVNDDPFGRGWVVRVKAEKVREDAARLLRGSPARSWFRQEIDRLLSTVFDQAAFQPALPDGGTFVEGLYREIDDVAWKKLTESFFGVAPDA